MTLTDVSHMFVGRFRPLFSRLLQAITRLRSCIPLQFSISHVLPPCLRHQKREAKRRALLIGISKIVETSDSVAGSSEPPETEDGLKGPHKEAESMGALLRDQYGYPERHIKYLLDRPGYDYPTRENILREMKALVKGAKAGDRFFIHFSGHSDQEETTDPEEDDGMNEYILTCLSGEKIMDDELKSCLVKSLPPGSRLTAIFDSCHSGTLLDLPHYRCNRVHLPFENKGVRRTKPLWRNIVRQQAMLPQSVERTSRHVPIPRRRASKSMSRVPLSDAERSLYRVSDSGGRQILSINTNIERSISSALCEDSRWCVSPDDNHEYCDGFGCAEGAKDDGPGPDVICISSSGDGQETWEDADGSSVTAELIAIFMENPRPLLSQVMSTISIRRHEAFRSLHNHAVKFREKRRFRRFKKKQRSHSSDFNPEMINFQIPQLSSLKRLPWDQQWDP
ncbi:unnamed protein product [Cyclocybe aegerita]|uniref:Peptidase C14 caspase domain-containing protein n=1 Tax=Cyclocybe aegerita TaxID=1973307 RepID=A0A8S0VTZ4_CYCAE|nr:unnamed protein product [Cyclocybe aegerita]